MSSYYKTKLNMKLSKKGRFLTCQRIIH